ncbi:hypothetical protein [Sorlinia euscelidii]|uniref:hypothetical protein n=1 Tax=Sorlinia euscelidii TaxID=3081148 RepID=UPI003AAA833C
MSSASGPLHSEAASQPTHLSPSGRGHDQKRRAGHPRAGRAFIIRRSWEILAEFSRNLALFLTKLQGIGRI